MENVAEISKLTEGCFHRRLLSIISVQQVKEVTTRLAAAILFAHEAKPGDNVCVCAKFTIRSIVMLTPWPHFFLSLLFQPPRLISFPSGPIFGLLSMACLRAGVVPALANPVYTPHELRHVCKLVGAKLILTAPMLRPGFEEANIQGATIVNCSRPVKGDEAGDSLWQRLEGIALEQAEQILARSGANDVSWDKPAGIFFRCADIALRFLLHVRTSSLISIGAFPFSSPCSAPARRACRKLSCYRIKILSSSAKVYMQSLGCSNTH